MTDGIQLSQAHDLDVDAVLERVGVGSDEELRQSRRRRRYLQKLARVLTPARPDILLDAAHPTASVEQSEDEPVIHITARGLAQPVTDLPRDIFDMTVQEALLIHEVGHILYTDHEAFEESLTPVAFNWKPHYKRVWNTLEDGAIEAALRRRFSVTDELYVLNANLFESGAESTAAATRTPTTTDDTGIECDLFSAVAVGLSDMAVFDSGLFRQLRDDTDQMLTMRSEVERQSLRSILPAMKAVVADVLQEPDPVARTGRIAEFWDDLSKLLTEANESGQEQPGQGQWSNSDGNNQQTGGFARFSSDSQHNSSDQTSDSSGSQNNMLPVMPIAKPDDTENASIRDAEPATVLTRQDPNEIDDRIEQTIGLDSPSGTDEQTTAMSATLAAQRRGQLRQEAENVDGVEQLLTELREYDQILDELTADDVNGTNSEVEICVPDSKELTGQQRFNECESMSQRLTKRLSASLQHDRQSRELTQQRHGRLDRARMVAAERGSLRVFKRETEGENKEYDCVIVIDRSGSMDGDRVAIAEEAATALGLALEELQINVTVLSMLGRQTHLENVFGSSMRNDAGTLLSGVANDGTPLSETVAIARKRVERRGETDQPFMIVITDGFPNKTDAYLDQLNKSNFPILGVYVQTGVTHDDYFHQTVHIDEPDEIEQRLTRLIRTLGM